MRKLKVIQILPTLNTGGVERGVLDFNNYLVKKGHESYVISNGGRQVKNLIEESTKLGREKAADWRAWKDLVRKMEEKKI